tara:strand:+ start:4162 stop:4713 length:552 start_codon:yes stop_codon:yes gene_type:complete
MRVIHPVWGIERIQNHYQIHQTAQCYEQHGEPVDIGKSDAMYADVHRLILNERLIEKVSNERNRTVEGLPYEPDAILFHVHRIKPTYQQPREEKKQNSKHDEESSPSLTEKHVSKAWKDPSHECSHRVAAPRVFTGCQLIMFAWSGHAGRPENSASTAMIRGSSSRPEQIGLKFRTTRTEYAS